MRLATRDKLAAGKRGFGPSSTSGAVITVIIDDRPVMGKYPVQPRHNFQVGMAWNKSAHFDPHFVD